ncbi:transaldolase [Neptunicella sp. SCSIO 80796]|uniref:transaldolase n=1 Tax=Neptunicella plasticusilytica TaxID=3117012 RepID=UPI003A4E3B52
MPNQLEQLKSMTTVVADTGDFAAIKQYQPQDATTNPSLVLKAIEQIQYQHLTDEALQWAKTHQQGQEVVTLAADKLAVMIGCQLLDEVPGLVSTEVDARLSFDTKATIDKAHQLLSLYQQTGADTSRILIKIAATWEGIDAARVLEQQGVKCNLTLIFGFAQTRACAEAGIYLISPFVGRILDWYKKINPEQDYTGEKDPGVISVRQIYQYFKQNRYDTIVMGASFRNIQQIQWLAGCDRLTISPVLLNDLADNQQPLTRHLQAGDSLPSMDEVLTEQAFRWQMNQDQMATEKLAEGIRQFGADQLKLEKLLTEGL